MELSTKQYGTAFAKNLAGVAECCSKNKKNMKKIFFLLAIAVLTVTGCRSTDNGNTNSNAQNPSVAPPVGGGTKDVQ